MCPVVTMTHGYETKDWDRTRGQLGPGGWLGTPLALTGLGRTPPTGGSRLVLGPARNQDRGPGESLGPADPGAWAQSFVFLSDVVVGFYGIIEIL